MLRGKNVNLRLITEADLYSIYNLTSEVKEKGLYWPIVIKSHSSLLKEHYETGFWIENFGKMLITNKSDEIVGEIAFFEGVWYLPGYEIGFQIYKEEDRNKGYVSEALKIFSAYLFSVKEIERLELCTIKENIGSKRVAEKCGFVFEGLKRNAVFNRGNYYDIELFSLLREDSEELANLID